VIERLSTERTEEHRREIFYFGFLVEAVEMSRGLIDRLYVSRCQVIMSKPDFMRTQFT
jgi:hypothetical protein